MEIKSTQKINLPTIYSALNHMYASNAHQIQTDYRLSYKIYGLEIYHFLQVHPCFSMLLLISINLISKIYTKESDQYYHHRKIQLSPYYYSD